MSVSMSYTLLNKQFSNVTNVPTVFSDIKLSFSNRLIDCFSSIVVLWMDFYINLLRICRGSPCEQLVPALAARCESVESTTPRHFDWTRCWPVYLLSISSRFVVQSVTNLQHIEVVEFGRYSCVLWRCPHGVLLRVVPCNTCFRAYSNYTSVTCGWPLIISHSM